MYLAVGDGPADGDGLHRVVAADPGADEVQDEVRQGEEGQWLVHPTRGSVLK